MSYTIIYLEHSTTPTKSESRTIRLPAISRFTSVLDRLSPAIASCINGVVLGLHSNSVIGFDFTNEIVTNTSETPATKALKVVIQLERSLRIADNPEDLLCKICLVLTTQGDTQLNEIAARLMPQVRHSLYTIFP